MASFAGKTIAIVAATAICFLLPVPAHSQESQDKLIEEEEEEVAPYVQVDLRDYIAKLFKKRAERKKEEDKEKKKEPKSIFVIPIIASNPTMGTSIGAAMSGMNCRESESEKVSSVLASVSYTSKKFFILNVRSDLTRSNKLHLLGDWRYYKYRERTYGLGSGTSSDIYQDYDFKWFRLKEAALRPVFEKMEIGIDYDLDVRYDIQPSDEGSSPGAVPVVPETGTTVSSGIGPVFIYDSTDNRINASRGFYIDGKYRFFPKWLGSDESWQLLDTEARGYLRLPSDRRQVFAFWTLAQIVTAGTAPYFDNPANAWDTYGRTTRGYIAGRFRGTGWLYGEVEYRVDLTRNGFIGAVAFLNASSFSADDNYAFNDWAFAGGLGVRFKVDKRTGSNIAIDVGLGESGSNGIYLAFNEAF